ncbi:MAG: 4Fe-4S dicluster domain-containing protein [Methylococcales bacterium]|nr:4Fe-4S dicluster domain-containing protein [Methylococcales bacterium]
MHDLIEKTDLCVKCGLCLPHCPTYNKIQNENESPRGRIALIQAWANKELTGSAKLQSHIDNCLLCRSCENVCPALVPYGQIIDDFRNTIPSTKKSSLDLTLLKNIAHNKKLSHVAKSLLKNYQSSTLQKIARFVKLPKILKLDKVERILSDKPIANQFVELKNH